MIPARPMARPMARPIGRRRPPITTSASSRKSSLLELAVRSPVPPPPDSPPSTDPIHPLIALSVLRSFISLRLLGRGRAAASRAELAAGAAGGRGVMLVDTADICHLLSSAASHLLRHLAGLAGVSTGIRRGCPQIDGRLTAQWPGTSSAQRSRPLRRRLSLGRMPGWWPSPASRSAAAAVSFATTNRNGSLLLSPAPAAVKTPRRRLQISEVELTAYAKRRLFSAKGVLRFRVGDPAGELDQMVDVSATHLEHKRAATQVAVGETVILLHPPLPLAGVSIAMERERQQHDRTLADG